MSKRELTFKLIVQSRLCKTFLSICVFYCNLFTQEKQYRVPWIYWGKEKKQKDGVKEKQG